MKAYTDIAGFDAAAALLTFYRHSDSALSQQAGYRWAKVGETG